MSEERGNIMSSLVNGGTLPGVFSDKSEMMKVGGAFLRAHGFSRQVVRQCDRKASKVSPERVLQVYFEEYGKVITSIEDETDIETEE